MIVLLSLVLMALTVKEDHTSLRTGCAVDSDVVASLPGGAPLTIRYALSGQSTPCYKVAVQADGKTVEGYLAADAIEGLDEFEKGRREAAWLDTAQVMSAVRASVQTPALTIGVSNQALAGQVTKLIETGQPTKALALLEPEIRKRPDPGLLALAGVAAWRGDESSRALEFWRSSLDLSPNPDIENLYKRVERETRGDRSAEKLYGLRVALRYDAAAVPVETARQMVTALDDAFSRVSAQLGCAADERIVAIVQSREAYRKTTDAAEWNGGQYDGRIRVPIFDGQGLDSSMRRALAHETTHACLSLLGRWPSWLQEGLAQKLSGDTLAPADRKKIAEMTAQGKLPRLNNLRQDWSRMDADHARASYALSLAAVELLYENYHEDGVRNLIHSPERLAAVTADLDQRLGLQQ
jgi:hypothetical protein